VPFYELDRNDILFINEEKYKKYKMGGLLWLKFLNT
jgi:hypothetical protein